MEGFDFDKEAALLKEKEEWAHKVAEAVVASRAHPAIDFDIAIAGARCASLWIDIFKEATASYADDEIDIRDPLKQSRYAAIEKSGGLFYVIHQAR